MLSHEGKVPRANFRNPGCSWCSSSSVCTLNVVITTKRSRAPSSLILMAMAMALLAVLRCAAQARCPRVGKFQQEPSEDRWAPRPMQETWIARPRLDKFRIKFPKEEISKDMDEHATLPRPATRPRPPTHVHTAISSHALNNIGRPP